MAIGLDDYVPKDQDDVNILSFPLFVLNLFSLVFSTFCFEFTLSLFFLSLFVLNLLSQ